jgi:hypothetical protein
MPPITGNAYNQPIPLPDGSTAILRIPEKPMSEENFNFIEKFLKLIKPNITLNRKQNDENEEAKNEG